MTQIRKLSDDVVAAIAAGEVITRPAAVVKELIENSLDANATSVHIELQEGGMQETIVVDDGEGILSNEVVVAFEKHTTSKIKERTEIETVKSLGFRGEALASITAAARVTMQTRAKGEDVGTMLSVVNGKVESQSEIGMDVGTRVRVANLFMQMPARKKFLKKPLTEYRRILTLVTAYVLANPEVAFELIHNGKQVLGLPKNQELLERIDMLFGEEYSKSLIKVNVSSEHAFITGFIGNPSTANVTARRQFAFINKRPIDHAQIAGAVKAGYGSLLPSNLSPPFILFVVPPKGTVDVNSHPQKRRVRFSNEEALLADIQKVISNALNSPQSASSLEDKGMDEYLADKLRVEGAWDPRVAKVSKNQEILQIHDLYLAFESENGIVVIDQHAAHERILYESYLEEFEKKKGSGEKKQLMTPILLDLSPDEHVHLVSYLRELIDLGFEIEDFGGGSFRVRAVPEVFVNRDIEKLIPEVLEDIEKGQGKVDEASHATLSYLACRSAIKDGDILSVEERRNLITKLAETQTNYTCPHGRPVRAELSLKELAKLFHRR